LFWQWFACLKKIFQSSLQLNVPLYCGYETPAFYQQLCYLRMHNQQPVTNLLALPELSDINSPTLIVIAGPTASGKTAMAIQLAKHYNSVIISADSRQFYREMSIGTAKPTAEELAEVKHYFIDSLSITENFTVGDFEKQCLSLLAELFKIHNTVILAGGSGLFIKAVTEGFDAFPDVDPNVRKALNKEFEEQGIASLQEKLKMDDPDY